MSRLKCSTSNRMVQVFKDHDLRSLGITSEASNKANMVPIKTLSSGEDQLISKTMEAKTLEIPKIASTSCSNWMKIQTSSI